MASQRRQGHSAWQGDLGRAFALLAMTLIAYWPVIQHATFIWDDPDYVVNNPVLRDAGGLRRMWFEPRSLPQYYPMVHTTFWVEYHLWGLSPTGYHIDNILLHAASAVMLWLLLRQLRIPGAWLAAAVFAVHPVMVESVAWVTERKNVLSLALYLAAFLTFWKYRDDEKRWGWYGAALTLFVMAMLSKTVACSWPAAMLLVVWWKQGGLRRKDVALLAPFFVIGASLGLVTAMLERQHVGAEGAEWAFSLADRSIIAGRAIWFYADKLLWPANLTFIYPRWTVPLSSVGWIATAMVVVIAAALFVTRRRIGRGWLVAWLFFIGTLFPALGFVNVYPMRYSFVADHFQYHASIGLIAAIVAAATLLAGRYRKAGLAVATCVLIPLGVATIVRGFVYQDEETLWTDTVRRNPGSWMAHLNLGHVHVRKAERFEAERRPDEAKREYLAAKDLYRRALELGPDVADTHWDVGIAYSVDGDYDRAIAEFDAAIRYDPRFAEAYWSMGNAYSAKGDAARAADWYRKAIAVRRDNLRAPYPEAGFNLGDLLERQGDLKGAAEAYQYAIDARPDYAKAHAGLGRVLGRGGDLTGATRELSAAVEIEPHMVDAQVMLIRTLAMQGRQAEAQAAYQRAAAVIPNFDQILAGAASQQQGRP